MDRLEAPSLNTSTAPDEGLQHLDFATERARIMLGCYRKGEANDPQMYSSAVAALLSQYSQTVIYEVTNPLTGLPSKTDFMPTLKELKFACEQEANREHRINNTKPATRSLPKYESKPDLSRPSHEDLVKSNGRFVGAFERPGDKWNTWGAKDGTRQFNYGK